MNTWKLMMHHSGEPCRAPERRHRVSRWLTLLSPPGDGGRSPTECLIVDSKRNRRLSLLSLFIVTLYLALLFAGFRVANLRGLGWAYLLCGGLQMIVSHLPWQSLYPLNSRGMTLVEGVVVFLTAGVLVGIGP
ncbi:hypothetical protein Poly51_55770 [Rubripirellula tenax]|uniref:Uncharacterized protein n=1 Tax=Rubripirellula tenax TaxID=2528015 RepID=A0A5C6EB39_9BACT|nr:hypothetical protein [Rubripirellula tenax]TWU46182.1 hypothetical protein Poly51_55770 [Rubripirellula tenax]